MLRLKEDTDSSRRQNSSAGRLREIAINNVLREYPFRSYSDVPFSRKGHILRVIDALVLVPETPAIIEAHEFYDTKKRTKEEDVARHRRFYSIYGPHFYTVLIGLHNRRDLERRIKDAEIETLKLNLAELRQEVSRLAHTQSGSQ